MMEGNRDFDKELRILRGSKTISFVTILICTFTVAACLGVGEWWSRGLIAVGIVLGIFMLVAMDGICEEETKVRNQKEKSDGI